ncbi:Integrase [Theobroma cacao]|nr:Integrase [Theobroma cacao]
MICYECKKPSHFKSECPLLKDETPKKNKRSKKAMVVAAWSNSDTSSFETNDEKFEERANICLMAQEDETEVELNLKETCSKAQLGKKQPWYLDSGCSRHMIGNEELFAQLKNRKGGTVSFGNDSKSKIYGIGTIVDDYSRYTWVYFLAHKNDALQAFLSYCKKVENEKGLAIVSIRSDHGGEFENNEFEKLCNEKGLDHNFSTPRTP